MITSVAICHCACSESPDVIRPLAISSEELWSTLFVPPRVKTFYATTFREIHIIQSSNNFSKHQGTCLNLI